MFPPTRLRRSPSPGAVGRRRWAAGALALLSVVAAGWAFGPSGPALPLGGAGPADAPARLEPVAARAYVVQAGDSLWAIGRSLQPDGDVRPLVARMLALRNGRPLRVGERIVLPGRPEAADPSG